LSFLDHKNTQKQTSDSKKKEGDSVQGDDKTNRWRFKRMGAIGTRKTKVVGTFVGGKRESFGKFSKDGSVFACMQRK
jgi:hypothetical protein